MWKCCREGEQWGRAFTALPPPVPCLGVMRGGENHLGGGLKKGTPGDCEGLDGEVTGTKGPLGEGVV